MREYLCLGAFLLVVVAGFAAFTAVYPWAPMWAREIVIGVGSAWFVADLWRGRMRSMTRLSHEASRLAVAFMLIVVCAALTGWAIGAWTAGAFVAALGVGGVRRRRPSAV